MTGSTITLAGTIADRLRDNIHTGVIAPGGRLPTEEALAAEHGVARGTIRNAYQLLVVEGLIESRNSRGYYVRTARQLVWRASDPERNISTDDGPQDTWSRCVREQAGDPAEDITTEIVIPDQVALRYLQLPEPEPLLARRRFRYVDKEPSSTADSFYLRKHVFGTPVELPGQVYPGVYAVFAEIGLPWIRTVDHVVSRAPTRDETRELRIPRGVPVTEVIRISYAAPALPVRLTKFVLPGDRHIVQYELRGEAPQ